MPQVLCPVKTTGDGNCLLNAVSRAMFGLECFHEVLRDMLSRELIENRFGILFG